MTPNYTLFDVALAAFQRFAKVRFADGEMSVALLGES
jgi:hypothetical protein